MLNVLCRYVEFVAIVLVGTYSRSRGRGFDPVKRV